ncbi:hypothetical protein B566_EDAN014007 [Ephemera danica]|nr:hypothetical protein B566_EDAN014007 [Ephemera danica]
MLYCTNKQAWVNIQVILTPQTQEEGVVQNIQVAPKAEPGLHHQKAYIEGTKKDVKVAGQEARNVTAEVGKSPVSSSSATNSSSALPQALVDNTPSSAEQLRAKVQRAIQAARSADNLLRQRRGEAADPNVPVPIPQAGLLEEINSDKFVQRSYTSSATAPRASLPDIPLPVVVDLTEEPKQDGGDLGVMSPALLEDQDGKQQRWVKKLFAIRQRALLGEPMVT